MIGSDSLFSLGIRKGNGVKSVNTDRPVLSMSRPVRIVVKYLIFRRSVRYDAATVKVETQGPHNNPTQYLPHNLKIYF